jgi:hypothetical protein
MALNLGNCFIDRHKGMDTLWETRKMIFSFLNYSSFTFEKNVCERMS